MRIDSLTDKPLRSNEAIVGAHNTKVNNGQSDSLAKEVSEIGEDRLRQLIEQGNKVLQRMDTRLQWSIHKESKQFIVRVLDTNTNEVLREIPPEKYLELVQNLCEQVGLFLDEKR